MKVSICVPSYNLGHLIAETLDSVFAQSFTDWELLIEDDASTDNSLAVISGYVHDPRVKVFTKRENEGQNRTTNNLVRRASGEYIVLLPADDVLAPDKLALQVEYLDANPQCGICFGWPRFMDERGKPIRYEQEGIETMPNFGRDVWRSKFRNGNYLFIATSMYRRSLHESLGYFDEDLHILADLEWYMRIVKGHDLHVIQKPLATIRQRDRMANLSAPTPRNLERNFDELELLRERHYPVDRSRTKYLIATPFYEMKGYVPYIKSLAQTFYALARHTNVEFDWTDRSGDSYVWRARNVIAEYFMESDASHLIFIDSDQGWDLEGFMRLLKADVEVVGGFYPVKNNWEQYGGTVYTDEHGFPEVDKETGLIRAQKVPTGFMKIKRTVFEKLKKAFPENWYWETGDARPARKMFNYFGHITEGHVALGEDISFCRRWEMIGGTLWCEPRCTIEHMGVQSWKGNYHEYLLRRPGGSQGPALERDVQMTGDVVTSLPANLSIEAKAA